ncbi:Retrotransposon gag protein [Corchorus capsularis]|uniref:Retrotransposon gag protein n=1 Tax=Corchorus capsularis TaxID=210143 RepID=A0A1R3J3V7_COCAP|nr:Retrotransposon gag protein [Corchorus capsularis]
MAEKETNGKRSQDPSNHDLDLLQGQGTNGKNDEADPLLVQPTPYHTSRELWRAIRALTLAIEKMDDNADRVAIELAQAKAESQELPAPPLHHGVNNEIPMNDVNNAINNGVDNQNLPPMRNGDFKNDLGAENAPPRQINPILPPDEVIVDNLGEMNQVEERNVAYVPPHARVNGANNNGANNNGANNYGANIHVVQNRNGAKNGNGAHHQAAHHHASPPPQVPIAPYQEAMPYQINRDQIVEMIQDIVGPGSRRMGRPTFQAPYPEEYDRLYPFPRGYKIPEFNPSFSGLFGEHSTLEHIARFTIQCGEASSGFHKLRLFLHCITGNAFTWYINLPPNSVRTWEEMERVFHTQFYRTEPEVSVGDLSRLYQRKGESAEDYLARFKKLRNRCHTPLLEAEFVHLAHNGLDLELRKKFEGVDFRDLYEMSTKVARYETLLREEAERRSSSYGTYYQEPNYELGVAEVVKVDHMIKLPLGHVIPPQEEIKDKKYCKYHDSWTHSTNDCTVFQNVVQEKIERGFLKFPEAPKKEMQVDKDPYPASIHMVSINFPKDGRLTKEENAKGVAIEKDGENATTKVADAVTEHADANAPKSKNGAKYLITKVKRYGYVDPEPKPLGFQSTKPLSPKSRALRLQNPRKKVEYPPPIHPMEHLVRPKSSQSNSALRRKLYTPTSHHQDQEAAPTERKAQRLSKPREVEEEVALRKEHTIQNLRPRMVRPTPKAKNGTWQKVQHPKFPSQPIKRNRNTWRRRGLRRRAKERKEMEKAPMEVDESCTNEDITKQEMPHFITSATTIEELVSNCYKPWKAKALIKNAKLDEKALLLNWKEAELDARASALTEVALGHDIPDINYLAREGKIDMETILFYRKLVILAVREPENNTMPNNDGARDDGSNDDEDNGHAPESDLEKRLSDYFARSSLENLELEVESWAPFEVTTIMTIDDIVKKGVEYWKAEILLETAYLKERHANIKKKEVEHLEEAKNLSDERSKIEKNVAHVLQLITRKWEDDLDILLVDLSSFGDVMEDGENLATPKDGTLEANLAKEANLNNEDNTTNENDTMQAEEFNEKSENSIVFGQFTVDLLCKVLILPCTFAAKTQEKVDLNKPLLLGNDNDTIQLPQKEEVAHSGGNIDGAKAIVFTKPEEQATFHIKPLYIKAHVDGIPMNRVLDDNGATVNLLPHSSLRKLGKCTADLIKSNVTVSDFSGAIKETMGILPTQLTISSKTSLSAFFVVDSTSTYNALLGRDWIHSNWCVPSSLHQMFMFWNGAEVEVVQADTKPFKVESHAVDVRFYDGSTRPVRFMGQDKYGRPVPILSTHEIEKETLKEAMENLVRPNAIIPYRSLPKDLAAPVANATYQNQNKNQNEITMDELDHAPMKLDDLKAEVQDPLLEIDLGTDGKHRPVYISQLLAEEDKPRFIALLKEYKDCFAWDYDEMPGLSRELVEHRLSIIDEHRPYQQPPRRIANDVILKVKEEVERLLKAGFIRTARYVEWISNIVPVVKKNGKIRVCVDFRNLNSATPKDEYPMPIADLLVDGAAQHRMLSFMDRHSGYNQIYIAGEDIHKTAFSMSWLLKGQAIADFLADHPCIDLGEEFEDAAKVMEIALAPWILEFDGSSTTDSAGASIIISSPQDACTMMAFHLDFDCTNNQAEYEALIIGLEMLREMKATFIHIKGDSLLVINQLTEEYKCTSPSLLPYYAMAIQLMDEFDDVSIEHVPRHQNDGANVAAQLASGITFQDKIWKKVVHVERRSMPSELIRENVFEVCNIDHHHTDWREPFIQYLNNPSIKVDRRTRTLAVHYTLLADELYRRGEDGVYLRCLDKEEARKVLKDVHQGLCGAHQAGRKMRWLIRRHGFYWPSVLKVRIEFAKGCEECQKYGPVF